MAQAEVNTILAAIQGALARREAQRRLDIEQQNVESERERRQAETEQAKNVLAEQHAQHQAQLDLEKQQAKLNLLNTTSLLSQRAQAGEPIPGDVQTPLAPQGVSALPPEQQLITHTIPNPLGGEPISFQTVPPEALAARQRILNAPAEEAKIREQTEQQKAETQRQLELAAQQAQIRYDEETRRQAFELNKQQNEITAQRALRDSENASALQRAYISATGGLSSGPLSGISGGSRILTDQNGEPTIQNTSPADTLLPIINDIRDGKLSDKDVKSKYPKLANAIDFLTRQRGYSTLSNDQKDRIKDLEQVAGVVPTLFEMNQLRMNNESGLLNPLSQASKTFNADKDIVGRYIPAIARVLSGTKRYNTQEGESYANALIPGRVPFITGGDTQVKKYNDFVTKDLQDAFDTATSDLPDGQRAIIRSRLGLTRLPYLGQVVNPQQNNQQGKITVRRKSDNQLGTINLQDYDPAKYDRQ